MENQSGWCAACSVMTSSQAFSMSNGAWLSLRTTAPSVQPYTCKSSLRNSPVKPFVWFCDLDRDALCVKTEKQCFWVPSHSFAWFFWYVAPSDDCVIGGGWTKAGLCCFLYPWPWMITSGGQHMTLLEAVCPLLLAFLTNPLHARVTEDWGIGVWQLRQQPPCNTDSSCKLALSFQVTG